jgi:uncharacterized membrane protein YidH (DUF202 family)
MKKKLNPSLAAILIGIGLIIMSVYTFNKTDKFLDKATETKGVVVDVYIKQHSKTDSDKKNHKPEYCPVIKFATEDGDTLEFKSTSGSTNFDYYKTGKEVDVLYDPDNPSNARIKNSKQTTKTSSFIMIGVGILVIVGGVFKFIYDRKKNKGNI